MQQADEVAAVELAVAVVLALSLAVDCALREGRTEPQREGPLANGATDRPCAQQHRLLLQQDAMMPNEVQLDPIRSVAMNTSARPSESRLTRREGQIGSLPMTAPHHRRLLAAKS